MRSVPHRRALRPAASVLILAALIGAGCSGDVTRFAYLNKGAGGYGASTAYEARPQASRPVSSQPRYSGGTSNTPLPAPQDTRSAAVQPVQTAPTQVAAATPAAAPVRPAPTTPTVVATPAPIATATPQVEATPVASEPVRTVAVAPAPTTQASPKTDVATTEKAASAGDDSFRWPVRGRIISEFGSKPDGQKNDGINLVVPEGTPVKASRDGEVIYSGNELEGYGNLVLVRHPGNWVTAYAHNSELLVKRGDQVRRGQAVAKAGRTGSVSFPQVHFEIRKGATPVNPMSHLNG